MRPKEGYLHFMYIWLVVGLAVWQLTRLFPGLDMDLARELMIVVALGVLAEWLAVSYPHGQLSGSFILVISTFLIYGQAATVWVSFLATLFGQGIANRGNPLRTTLFNTGQYALAAVAAGYLFTYSGGAPGLAGAANILPLAAFTLSYAVVNHLLVYFYLLPKRNRLPQAAWLDALRWDGLSYLFTLPLGLLISLIYGYIGLLGTVLLFSSVLALQLILRFYVRLQVANRELSTFYEVARFLEKNPGPLEVLEKVLKSAGRAFTFHSGVVYLRGEKDAFLPGAATGPYASQLSATEVYAGEGLLGWIANSLEPEIIFDTRADPRCREEILGRVMRSLIIVPLSSGREALGLIVLGDKRPLAFDGKHLHIMAVLGRQAAIAVERSILQDRLEQALSRDNLTGLPTFTPLFEAAADLCDSPGGSQVGLILLDLDNFRVFNRRYGRHAGELALAEMAALVERAARRDDLAARYGGDEFALLLPGAGGYRLLDLAEALWEEVRGHIFLRGEGRMARLTVSIGVAEYPRDAGDAAGLFRAAQRALDKAKDGGGNRVDTAAVSLTE